MEITYGKGSIVIPDYAIKTEITPYLWPGHYGEWSDRTQEWFVWKLVSPSLWRVTSELLAPPLDAVKGSTVSRWIFRSLDEIQEFHVELHQSAELLHLSQRDPGQKHPESLPELHHPKHPAADSKHPVADLKHPVADLKHPAADLKHPVADLKHPVADSKHPAQAPVVQQAVWRIHRCKT